EIADETEETDDETEEEAVKITNKKKINKISLHSQTKKKRNVSKSNLFNLPPPPSFQKLQHAKAYHISQVKVADKLPIAKSAGKGREWDSLTFKELLIWFALHNTQGIQNKFSVGF
ncbi:20908_t:CDS:2, partial [Gigaspora rosea]